MNEEYNIIPIREVDRYDIMQWRNEQIYHLRQNKPLTKGDQVRYFEEVVSKLYEQEQPNQLLFSYLKDDICIGYGGLVHINWADQNAEISFIMATKLEKAEFHLHWRNFLSLIEQVAFQELKLHKIFTYAFDLRPYLYKVLEQNRYRREAVLKEHCYFQDKFIDVIIHSKINKALTFRKLDVTDKKLIFEWANEPEARKNSYNSKPIDFETHSQWFDNKISDTKVLILIFAKNQTPCGLVRFEMEEPNRTIIGISIDKKYRGQKLAHKMLEKACSYYTSLSNNSIYAYIKKDNVASIKSFQNAGFQKHKELIIKEIPSYEYLYTSKK